ARDELARRFAREIGVECSADDPANRLPCEKGLSIHTGDCLQRIVEPFPDVTGHLEDTVGGGAAWQRVDGDGPADAGLPEVGPLRIEQVAPRVTVAVAA